jgi:hypothetical protein
MLKVIYWGKVRLGGTMERRKYKLIEVVLGPSAANLNPVPRQAVVLGMKSKN